MEISLNLLWLAVAVIAASVWIFRWRPASRDSALSAAVALGCALVLLFPSISLTDDLHPQIVAVDAAAGKRNTCQLISSAGCKVSSAPGVASRLAAHLVAVVAQTFLSRQASLWRHRCGQNPDRFRGKSQPAPRQVTSSSQRPLTSSRRRYMFSPQAQPAPEKPTRADAATR